MCKFMRKLASRIKTAHRGAIKPSGVQSDKMRWVIDCRNHTAIALVKDLPPVVTGATVRLGNTNYKVVDIKWEKGGREHIYVSKDGISQQATPDYMLETY